MPISVGDVATTNLAISSEWFGFAQTTLLLREYLDLSDATSGADLNTSGTTSVASSVSFQLLDQGCIIDEKLNRNCTYACYENASLLWAGENAMPTLYNCMLYPLIARAYGQGILYDMVPTYNHTSGFTGYTNDTVNLMNKYGIFPRPDLDLSDPNQWGGINNCTTAYCHASGGQDCENITSLLSNNGWHYGTFVPHLVFNGSLCDSIAGTINQDLGGVGMIIAYLIQITILLAGWIIGTMNSAAIAIIHFTARFLYHSSDTSKHTRWKQAKRRQRKIRESRQAVALNAALVEFQKTQTFFVLAVSVAAILAVGDASYLQVSSWQDLWNNISFISTVALSGCYPIVLNLLVLRKTRNLSWFLLGISTACVAVSMTLWIYTNVYSPRVDRLTFTNGFDLPECGTSKPFNPTWTCLPSSQYSLDGFNADIRGLIFPLIVLAFLIAERIERFRDLQSKDNGGEAQVNMFVHARQLLLLRHDEARIWFLSSWDRLWSRVPSRAKYRIDDTRTGMRRFSRESTYRAEDWMEAMLRRCPPWVNKSGTIVRRRVITPVYGWSRTMLGHFWTWMQSLEIHKIMLWILDACYKVVPFLAEVGIVTINTVLFVQYASYLKVIGDGSWSLGQVISVTIWVPVVVEYVYLLICGIEEGFEYRLAEPYHVKKNDADSSDQDDADADTATLRKDSSPNDSGDEVELASLRDEEPTSVQRVLLVPKRSYTGT